MRLTPQILAAAGAALIMTSPVAAQAADYVIDSSHVHAAFSVNHLGFSNTVGQFDEIEGSFTFDEAAPEDSAVSVTIQTASIDTAHDKRDEHLRGDDFFKVEAFPTMTFQSTGVEVTGENTGKLTGDLTLLGVTQPVTLDVTFNKGGPHPMNAEKIVAGFSATGALKRSDFGMEYGLPVIGDDVEIYIEVEGIKQ